MSNGELHINGYRDKQKKPIRLRFSEGAAYVNDKGSQKTAFGEALVATLNPNVQAQFQYNINSEVLLEKNNNGTSTVENSMLKLSTGAAANQSASVETKIPLAYRPGEGGLARFTAIFSTGVVGSTQVIGVGNTSDGFFFGYNGESFGILRRYGGKVEIRTLTVTTASTTAENITIALDGDAKADVAVTASGNLSTTANEIASADYSSLGAGWRAYSLGDGVIYFISYDSALHAGSYSVTASTAVGTFAQALAGAAPTDDWTYQSNWSEDIADGEGSLPLLNQTAGNVYQIRYQWLGFGRILFGIEDSEDGGFHLVHSINYANQHTIPSVFNPVLPLHAEVKNTSNTSDVTLYSSSMGAFTEGVIDVPSHVHHGISVEYLGIGTTETPILTIHNKSVHQNAENRTRIKLVIATFSVEGTKPASIIFRLNPVLTGASYTDVSANTSVVSYDASATALSGGSEQIAFGLGKTDSGQLNIGGNTFFINPGEILTISGKASSGSIEGIVSMNWEEQF